MAGAFTRQSDFRPISLLSRENPPICRVRVSRCNVPPELRAQPMWHYWRVHMERDPPDPFHGGQTAASSVPSNERSLRCVVPDRRSEGDGERERVRGIARSFGSDVPHRSQLVCHLPDCARQMYSPRDAPRERQREREINEPSGQQNSA